jgi:conjugal transfer pilus assembly protein TraW
MKNRKIVLMLLISISMLHPAFAKDLGVMGETYPIVEIDFLEFIQSRASAFQQTGQWQHLQNKIQQDAIQYRDRPKRVSGILRVQNTKSWLFDPSIRLDHDVRTPDGKLIAYSGARVNPLALMTLSKALIFYNGDDPDQVAWVMAQDKALKGKDKLILVNGSVLQQEKRFNKSIYFDQERRLTSRFGITHVPAIIIQEGSKLRIKEVAL